MKRILSLFAAAALIAAMLSGCGAPAATVTPAPTEEVTQQPEATEQPAATETPAPSEAPAVTETPAATETPAPTEAPTETPAATAKPTEKPAATAKPKPTEKPSATPKPTEAPAASLTAAEVASEIKALYEGNSLEEIPGEMLSDLYGGLDVSKLESYSCIEPMMNVKAGMISVVKVKDAADVKEVRACLEARAASVISSFEHYLEDQYEVAKDYVVRVNGQWIGLFMAENAKDMADRFDELTK